MPLSLQGRKGMECAPKDVSMDALLHSVASKKCQVLQVVASRSWSLMQLDSRCFLCVNGIAGRRNLIQEERPIPTSKCCCHILVSYSTEGMHGMIRLTVYGPISSSSYARMLAVRSVRRQKVGIMSKRPEPHRSQKAH